jgi:hypothetical protein
MDDMASVGLQVDSRPVRKASGDLDKFAKSGDQAGGSAGRATGAIGGMSAKMVVAAAAAAALAAALAAGKFLNKFVDATVTAEAAQAQLGAAITSTGGAAGKSVADLNAHAAALQKVTNFGDEAINSMQGLLLTFTQIKGDQFDAATKATLDLATAMGTDLNSAALQVGKALNDPILGMTALSRSGIQFTEAQKEMVKGMVDANDTIGAQTIILAELEKQFGGSAEAARDTLGGALASLRNAFGDLFELSGPGSDKLRASIERLTTAVANPAFFAAVQSIGTGLFRAAEIGVNAMTALSGAFSFVSENIDTLAVAVIGLVSTAIPGAITGLVAMTGGMSAAGIATGIFTGAVSAARLALITFGGPLGIVYGLLGAAAGAFFLFRDNAGEMETASYDAESGALALAEALDKVTVAEPESSAAVIALANNNVKLADSAYEAASAELAKRRAMLSEAEAVAGGGRSRRGAILGNERLVREAIEAQTAAENALATAIRDRKLASEEIAMTMPVVAARTNDATDAADSAAEAAAALADEMDAITTATGGAGGGAADGIAEIANELEAAETATGQFTQTFMDGMGRAIDYTVDGFRDGFSGLLDIIKSTLLQAVQFAIANPIKLAMGIGGGGAGVAGAVGSGGILGGLTGAASAFGSGLSVVGNGLMAGGLGGAAQAGLGAISGGLSMGGLAGFATAAGAALPFVAAAAAVVSFFKSKTKTIDSGIRATIDMEDAMFESFKEIEKSRFFGLSKKRSTSFKELTGTDSAPLDAAVFAIRESVIGATESLGVSSDVFNGFSHNFELSLKGLDEAARASAISEEFTRMGDSLAGLVPHIDNMNDLFEVAANRVALTDRLLQAQGKTEELTARIRAREMDATNEHNKALLAQVFAAEDAAIAADALSNSLNENMFATGQDFMRAMSRTSNGQSFTPQQSDAELRAELRALNVSMERLVSTSEITAGNTGRGADAADDTLAFTLEQTL